MTIENVAAVIAIIILAAVAAALQRDRLLMRRELATLRVGTSEEWRAFFRSGWRAAESCARVQHTASIEHIEHHFSDAQLRCPPAPSARGAQGGAVVVIGAGPARACVSCGSIRSFQVKSNGPFKAYLSCAECGAAQPNDPTPPRRAA